MIDVSICGEAVWAGGEVRLPPSPFIQYNSVIQPDFRIHESHAPLKVYNQNFIHKPMFLLELTARLWPRGPP